MDHPSLAPRAVERLDAVPAESVTAPAPIPANATVTEKIAALVKQARDGDAAFQPQLRKAQDAMPQGNPAAGSEGWVSAEETISRTDALRSPVTQSLADLEAMQLASAREAGNDQTAAALSAAIAEVAAIDAAQRDAVAALQDRLSRF